MKGLLAVLLFSFLQFSAAAVAPTTFLQVSSHASIAKLHQNTYVLTLNNPTPYIDFFIKKPILTTGILNINNFLSLWNHTVKNNFSDNPPIASLAVITEKGDYQQIRVIVTNPSFGRGLVSYQIKTKETALIYGKLKHMVLIFDEFPFSPE